MLAVRDGIHKAVHELLSGAQQAGLHKVHHLVVLLQVVLQGGAREDDPPPRLDPVDGLVEGGLLVLEKVAFVTDNNVGTRVQQTSENKKRIRFLSLCYVLKTFFHCYSNAVLWIRIRNFFLDPEMFVLYPDPDRMKEQIY